MTTDTLKLAMSVKISESQARHILEPLAGLEERQTQLHALVRRVLLVNRRIHPSPALQSSPNGAKLGDVVLSRSVSGSLLEAFLPDAIFRVAVLDEGFSVEQAAMLYNAACAIVA